MANVEPSRKEEPGGLSAARAEFASSLARRLEAIHAAISAFEQNAMSAPHRDNLLRRLHALGASAKILGFAAAAETLSRAEQQLRTGLAETLPDDLVIVRELLTNLSNLVLRGSYSMRPGPSSASSGPPQSPSSVAQGPWCVLVCGSPLLSDTLKSLGAASSGFELVESQELARVRELCAMYGPDVVLLDASLDDVAPELQRLRDAPETAGVQFVVAQAAEGATETLKQAGAHTVLTTNFSPIALWRAANRSRTEEHNLVSAREPIGELGLRDLCERLSRELKRGLFDAADEQSQSAVVALGEGTEVRAAIWAAVARIRELVVAQSEGRIHFGPGPDGSVVLAPGAGLGLRGRTLADSASIKLTERRILVADDDPAVAWFVGGTLRAAGADVREAQDGRRALALAQQWWPELIVSDVLMPGLDGFALCRELKRDVALRDVPIILLSWKEDLLFRLRELGADADAYVRKEASASSLVDRARELLWPRISLERRLQIGQEVRGRLDGITPRTLIEAVCRLGRHVRITLRDASAHYDVRIRDHSLRAVTRTRTNGAVARGQSALAVLLGVSAGRFSVVEDDQPADDDFSQTNLEEVLRTPILRARAAQRVLSGAALGSVARVSLDPDTFADELSMLPLSLRPLVDELLRGTAPRQLLAAGAASLNSLESLLSDAARRGAVLTITGNDGEDLLTREILALSTPMSEQPPPVRPADPPTFSFQLTPSPLPAVPAAPSVAKAVAEEPKPLAQAAKKNEVEDEFDWASEASWESSVPPSPETMVQTERSSPYSRPRISAEWGGSERRKADEAIAADLGRTLAATAAASKSAPVKLELTSSPVTLRSTNERQPDLDGTPNLGDVVLSAASDHAAQAIPAYPIKTAHLGLTIGSGAFEAKLPPIPAAVIPKQPISATQSHMPAASAPELTNPGEPSVAIAGAHEAGPPKIDLPSASTNIEQPAGPNPPMTAADGEVVFPLCQSIVPSGRTPQPAVLPVAPPAPAEQEREPVSLTPESSAAAAVETSANTEQRTAPSEDAEPQVIQHGEDDDTANTHDELPIPVDAAQPNHKAPSSTPPRRNQWLVPVGLALTAGGLSFTLALPIVQRFSSRGSAPSSASSEPELTTGAAPSALAPAASEAPPEASPADTNTELPPGLSVAPDKGLLTLKTSGVHSIFIDDEFIGRGPERTVTLSSGQHKVRTSLNGEEHTETVEVIAGRLIQRTLDTSGN